MWQDGCEPLAPRKPEEFVSVMAVDGAANGNFSMRIVFILTLILSTLVGAITANGLVAQSPSTDLTTLFDLGNLVLDTNGDDVPDLVNASLVLGESPTLTETAAASEISARLGFETMAMNLPIQRGESANGIAIVIGRTGLAASSLASPGVDPTSLDAGEGAVAIRNVAGRTWIVVVGGDDHGLLAAARMFAGVLPHTRTLSTAKLSAVSDDLSDALESVGVTGGVVRLTQARARSGGDGIARVVAEVSVDAVDVDVAAAAVRALADADPRARPPAPKDPDEESAQADDPPLAYPGLGSVEVRLSGGPVIRLTGRAELDPPGPISARPGVGAKSDLDLSNLYTTDGLLGGGPIADRVDVVLVPGAVGIAGLPDLAGRLGLESIGFAVPLVKPSMTLELPGSQPTMLLVGTENHLTDQLVDRGLIDLEGLAPGEGLIEVVPDAFGSKSSLVVSGSDDAGASRALEQVALTFPHLSARGKDRPTVDQVEQDLWDALAGYSPVGQAAISMYKLDQIGKQLADVEVASARVLLSVEKADKGLAVYLQNRAATALGTENIEVVVDERDVQRAAPLFEESRVLTSEVDRFWSLFQESVVTAASTGRPIQVEARLSEPPELRAQIAADARQALLDAGADAANTEVTILSAFKQGYFWLEEVVAPRLEGRNVGEILIRFRRNDPPDDWPQQAINTPVRWLHEIFPIDEVLARDFGFENVRFEQVSEGPTYQVRVTDTDGTLVLNDTFDPKWVLRPYFDRFRDYEHVRVTTGWLHATAGDLTLADERIVTDPEMFWDYYQADVLPAIYDYVMDRHDGLPNGGSSDAPYFGTLTVEMQMSEPDYRLGIDNEIHAPMDALHEEIYFSTIEFFEILGRNSRGQGLTFPGRIIPVMRPKSDGTAATVDIQFTGFATSRPAVVVEYEDALGGASEIRLDIPKTGLARPSARLAKVRDGHPGLSHLAFRVRVDTEFDLRDSLITVATPQNVDRSMVSAEQIEATVGEIETLRAAGLYTSALAYDGVGSMEVWAEWTHEQNPDSRRVATLVANGTPAPLPDWRELLPEEWSYSGERIVQWETPIPPPEGHEMIAKMADAFDEASIYRVGRSYLGKDIWAMDLMPAVTTSHWSHVKATTFKPTVVYSAREHANEVSSTSHVLRHAELLLTDPEERIKLDKVNVVIHPFTNPDGAQLAYDLYTITPDYILHAGYLGALGQNVARNVDPDHPIYPEGPIRSRIWETWLPDIFLNPHGYPSHQVVQLFSGYTGLVRQGRVTERNWGFNKGWFMPSFSYVDDPEFPRHKDAAFTIRDYITAGINSNRDVFEMNQRNYARYRRYGADFDPEVFLLPMSDSVLIYLPLKGSTGGGEQSRGYDSKVTVWAGGTEAPDETAYGPWMELVGKAGLSYDQALLDYLYDGAHEVKRSGSRFFGGVSLRLNRPRPPEKKEKVEEDPL
jgi:hypothetical protein